MSAQTNLRKDRWGGSLENRARFLVEVINRVREVVPADFIVGVRLLAEDTPKQRGFDIDDTVAIVKMISKLGVDYIHVSQGATLAKSWKHPEAAANITVLRAAVPAQVAVIACGAVKTAMDAEQAMDAGADLVAMAKTAIIEPAWPEKARVVGYNPPPPPWTRSQLKAAGVSDSFVTYLDWQFKVVRG